jgi:hypothetical protein
MTFLSTPAQAALALNGLMYESVKPNVRDVITITLHDGAGGNCLDDNVQSPLSSRLDRCYSTTVNFEVQVMGFAPVGGGDNGNISIGGGSLLLGAWSGIRWVDENTPYILLAGALIMLLCVCRACWAQNKSVPGNSSEGTALPNKKVASRGRTRQRDTGRGAKYRSRSRSRSEDRGVQKIASSDGEDWYVGRKASDSDTYVSDVSNTCTDDESEDEDEESFSSIDAGWQDLERGQPGSPRPTASAISSTTTTTSATGSTTELMPAGCAVSSPSYEACFVAIEALPVEMFDSEEGTPDTLDFLDMPLVPAQDSTLLASSLDGEHAVARRSNLLSGRECRHRRRTGLQASKVIDSGPQQPPRSPARCRSTSGMATLCESMEKAAGGYTKGL